VKYLPDDKSKKGENAGLDSKAQNIPEEVLKQLPAEVKAQLGYVEEQKPIFKPASGANPGLSDSIDRLREGFEKIGLTLIGRMGEFASTLERVMMTVARIEKVENLTAEITYFLKNLQKVLDGFERNFNKVVDKMDNVEIDIERMAREITDLRKGIASGAIAMPQAVVPQRPVATPQPAMNQSTTNVVNNSSPQPTNHTQTPSPAQDATLQSAGGPLSSVFAELNNKFRAGMNTQLAADILDQARETISEGTKWTPAIYELGKVARNLRRTEELLSTDDYNKIKDILDQLDQM